MFTIVFICLCFSPVYTIFKPMRTPMFTPHYPYVYTMFKPVFTPCYTYVYTKWSINPFSDLFPNVTFHPCYLSVKLPLNILMYMQRQPKANPVWWNKISWRDLIILCFFPYEIKHKFGEMHGWIINCPFSTMFDTERTYMSFSRGFSLVMYTLVSEWVTPVQIKG